MSQSTTESRKLFQTRGPAQEKRRPAVDVLVLGMDNSADRSEQPVLLGTEDKLDRYCGVEVDRTLKVSFANWYEILWRIGNSLEEVLLESVYLTC